MNNSSGEGTNYSYTRVALPTTTADNELLSAVADGLSHSTCTAAGFDGSFYSPLRLTHLYLHTTAYLLYYADDVDAESTVQMPKVKGRHSILCRFLRRRCLMHLLVGFKNGIRPLKLCIKTFC